MNKVLIIDASETDGRIMSRLLIRAGYDPVKADNIETGRIEAAKLPPGAVIVTALRLSDGTARDLITRVRDKNFMFFNQAKDIEYWAAFQGRLIYLYSLVLIPEDKLPV